MSATMQDVARYAAVSTATVSRVLNNPERVRPETRQRVEEAIQALGYRLNAAGQLLRTQQTHRIAAIVDDLNTPHTNTILATCSAALGEAGYSLELCSTAGQAAQATDYLRQFGQRGRVDGVLWASEFALSEVVTSSVDQSLPILHVNSTSESNLRIDYQNAAYIAINYLLQAGHRRIAVLSLSRKKCPTAKQRITGYEQALRDFDLPYYPHLVYEVEQDEGRHWRMGIETLLDMLARPSAILAQDDLIAAQLYYACRQRGLSIGKELSIIGFGDRPFAKFLHPTLTTLHLPSVQIGQQAAAWLLRAVASDEATPSQPPLADTVSFETQLVVRDSVGLMIR